MCCHPVSRRASPNSWWIPYEQSLVESGPTAACPLEKVGAIGGEMQQLQGGYASVEGYHYALPPCTSGGCEEQELHKLKAALEHTPVSVCVNCLLYTSPSPRDS